jgi:C-terminal processing protease CtpA/Prc
MRILKSHFWLFIGILLIFYASVYPQDNTTDLSDAEKVYGLSVIWQEANYNFAFFDQVPDLNWDSVYKEFIPKVLKSESVFEYYRILQKFATLLGDGHTSVSMPQYLQQSRERPPIGIGEFQRRVYITNVDEPLKDKIPIGSEVIEIDGIATREYLEKEVFPYMAASTEQYRWRMGVLYMLNGRPDSEVEITLLTPTGEEKSITLARNRDGLKWYPPIEDRSELLEFRWIDDTIGYVALRSFSNRQIVDDFEAVLPDLYKAKGIILDLRDNGGGSTGIGASILAHFTADTLIGSTWRTREHVAAFKAWGKFDGEWNQQYREYSDRDAWHHGDPYTHPPTEGTVITVPVVVLISPWTGSAAEDFLVMTEGLPQFTLIGQPTTGSTGQPITFNLPGGGWGRVCTKRDTYPDGKDFVGVGIQPHIIVEQLPQDMIEGRDAVLDEAINFLANKK